jgi:hypothetical protein
MPTMRFRKRVLLGAVFLSAICLGGCATESLKPTFPASGGLKRPDRVLVYEFAVTPDDLKLQGVVGSQLDRPVAQTDEDIRLGRALAKSLSENLVSELRSRGINALLHREAAPPGDSTASIRGRLLTMDKGAESRIGFNLADKEVRTQIQIFQGSGLDVRLVAEAESVTRKRLDISAARSGAYKEAINADAKDAARVLTDRVAEYYRKQGWIK